ncbi:MAG: hypothetical protein ACOXZ5_00550 [Syntrophomonadaceae bacterium]
MKKNIRREYQIVGLIIALAVAVGMFSVSTRPELVLKYPGNFCVLEDSDFALTIDNELLVIGTSTWDDVAQIIPRGKFLGLSTIYQPDNLNCLLTFTEEENILYKAHISDPGLYTSRGIKLGDSMTRVVDTYGKNYASVFESGNQKDLDMVYGSDNNNSIIFQIRNNKVNRIILQKG